MITILAAYLWRVVLNKQFEGSSWYHHAIQRNAGNRDDEKADEARGSCDIMQPC